MAAPLDSQRSCQFWWIRFGSERLDERFRELADELEAAYYQHWRKGESCPWLGFDAEPTPALSEALFNELHGILWTLYAAVFHLVNMERPKKDRADEEKYRYQRDDQGAIISDRIANGRAWLEARPPARVAACKQAVEAKFGRAFAWP